MDKGSLVVRDVGLEVLLVEDVVYPCFGFVVCREPGWAGISAGG
jgi:hypothetical protein